MVAYTSMGDSNACVSLADDSILLSYPNASKLLEVSTEDMGQSRTHFLTGLLRHGETLADAFVVPGTRLVWADKFTKDEEHQLLIIDLDGGQVLCTLEHAEWECPELVPGTRPAQISFNGIGESLSVFTAVGTMSMKIELTAGWEIMHAVADPTGTGLILARRQSGGTSGLDLAIVDSKGRITSSTPILDAVGCLKLLVFPVENRVVLVTSASGGSSNEGRRVHMHSYERVGGQLRLDVEHELPGDGYVIQDPAASAAAFVHEPKHGNLIVTPIDPRLGLLKQPWQKAQGFTPSLEMQDLSGWE
jgi:hypothetical protein